MVSILQLFILIIPGVAFSVLILSAWCQEPGSPGWGTGTRPGEAAGRPGSFGAGFSCRAFRRLPGLHHLARSVQKLQALWPRVYWVNEHLVVRRILAVNRFTFEDPRAPELIPGRGACVSGKARPPLPLLLTSPFSWRTEIHM